MGLVFDANRARAADLVQLPRSIKGTSCSNCLYFRYEPQSRDRSIGYCSHYRLMMNVMGDWCCAFWSRPDAPLASPPGTPGSRSSPDLGRRFARRLARRYSRVTRGSGSSDSTDSLQVDERTGDSGGSRAVSGLQPTGGDLRVVALAPTTRPRHRFARAGDADDCGHKREGGEFADENTCATSRHKRREVIQKAKGDLHQSQDKLNELEKEIEVWEDRYRNAVTSSDHDRAEQSLEILDREYNKWLARSGVVEEILNSEREHVKHINPTRSGVIDLVKMKKWAAQWDTIKRLHELRDHDMNFKEREIYI